LTSQDCQEGDALGLIEANHLRFDGCALLGTMLLGGLEPLNAGEIEGQTPPTTPRPVAYAAAFAPSAGEAVSPDDCG
jgi:hypothetical protein